MSVITNPNEIVVPSNRNSDFREINFVALA